MASINDFKLVNLKSKKFFNLLKSELNIDETKIDDIHQLRFGFYPYILDSICGVKDISDILELITDTEFNIQVLKNRKFEDQGIDAVYIDHEEKVINLFNFKFRAKYNPDQKQKINETIISTKFINALINEDTTHLDNKIKKYAKEIILKLNSNDIWKMKLYIVSNEALEINKDDANLQQLEKMYDLEIIPFGLPKINELLSIRPEPINAELIISDDAIMSYSESSMSSSKSYIIRLSLSEVIRITSNNNDIRNEYNIEDIDKLANVDLEYNVLFDNVRGFVQKSKYNNNIERTLKEESSKFFMYNNGLTIIAKIIKADPINANKRVKLKIEDFQVLNGGQTLRTIHNFNNQDKDNINNFLSNSEVLVRIFTTNDEYINKIAEYTNSQNSISSVDLKSLSKEQIELEQFLDEHNIIYARKTGDTGLSNDKVYTHKISMEKYGQILYSLNGFPEKATNQKKQIFEKYYNDIFGENNLDINESPTNITNYFKIKNAYTNSKYSHSDQKIFYILYLKTLLPETSISELIVMLETTIKKFPTDKEISDARKLIQIKFKQFLDDLVKQNIQQNLGEK